MRGRQVVMLWDGVDGRVVVAEYVGGILLYFIYNSCQIVGILKE